MNYDTLRKLLTDPQWQNLTVEEFVEILERRGMLPESATIPEPDEPCE